MNEDSREYIMASGDSTITLKKYVMCVFTNGPDRGHTPVVAERIQREHLAYQDSLFKTGIIIVAGPFESPSEKRGIVIYDLGDTQSATKYVESDPAVKAGRLNYELLVWWTMKGSVIK